MRIIESKQDILEDLILNYVILHRYTTSYILNGRRFAI